MEMKLLLAIVLILCVSILSTVGLPMQPPTSPSSAERFYDEKLERYVDKLAEQIVNFKVHHHGHKSHSKHNHHKMPNFDVAPTAGDEEMQSDQPQPGLQASSITPEERRQMDKMSMTNNIKELLFDFINGTGNKHYGERDRSFYANCDQPRSTEENDDVMKLFFTISHLEDNLATANLRLYRKTLTNHTTYNDNPTDFVPCASSNNQNPQDEKFYRVTVYYHIKGGKKHRLKKKIGDSRVINESMPFVNLNVLQGVRELNKGKLFGVIIQLEDQFGATMKASDFFKGPTCTVGMPSPQPLPTPFEEALANLGRSAHSTDCIDKPMQPKLDIKTIQIALSTGVECNGDNHLRHAHYQRLRMERLPTVENKVIYKAGTPIDRNELQNLYRSLQNGQHQALSSQST